MFIFERERAVSTEPDVGLEPTNCEIMTWAGVRRLTNWATQVLPSELFLLVVIRADLQRNGIVCFDLLISDDSGPGLSLSPQGLSQKSPAFSHESSGLWSM